MLALDYVEKKKRFRNETVNRQKKYFSILQFQWQRSNILVLFLLSARIL